MSYLVYMLEDVYIVESSVLYSLNAKRWVCIALMRELLCEKDYGIIYL